MITASCFGFSGSATVWGDLLFIGLPWLLVALVVGALVVYQRRQHARLEAVPARVQADLSGQ